MELQELDIDVRRSVADKLADLSAELSEEERAALQFLVARATETLDTMGLAAMPVEELFDADERPLIAELDAMPDPELRVVPMPTLQGVRFYLRTLWLQLHWRRDTQTVRNQLQTNATRLVPWLAWGTWQTFLRDLFRLWYPEHVDRRQIRELGELVHALQGSTPRKRHNHSDCFSFTVEPDGDIGPCDKYVGDRAAGTAPSSPNRSRRC